MCPLAAVRLGAEVGRATHGPAKPGPAAAAVFTKHSSNREQTAGTPPTQQLPAQAIQLSWQSWPSCSSGNCQAAAIQQPLCSLPAQQCPARSNRCRCQPWPSCSHINRRSATKPAAAASASAPINTSAVTTTPPARNRCCLQHSHKHSVTAASGSKHTLGLPTASNHIPRIPHLHHNPACPTCRPVASMDNPPVSTIRCPHHILRHEHQRPRTSMTPLSVTQQSSSRCLRRCQAQQLMCTDFLNSSAAHCRREGFYSH